MCLAVSQSLVPPPPAGLAAAVPAAVPFPRPKPVSELSKIPTYSEMVFETLDPMAATAHHDLVGLARVSTETQDAQLQRDALTEAGCGRIFEEKVSTRKTDRPGLATALDYLRPRHTLCVRKLDQL